MNSEADAKLNVVISAQDDASDTFKQVGENMVKAGAGMVAVGGAITGVLAMLVKAGGDAQVQMASVDATLNAMKGTTVNVATGIDQATTSMKLTGSAAQDVKDKINTANLTIAEANKQIADLSSQHVKAGKATQDHSVQIAQLHEKIISTQNDITRYNEELGKTKTTHEQLTKSVTLTADAIALARKQIIDTSDAEVSMGFDNNDLAVSLTQLYQKTGDMTRANEMNNLAMDLARAKHISLAEASASVNKALSGNIKGLQMYLPAIKDGMTATEALAAAQKNLGGQAQAFTETFEGQMAVFQATFGQMQETIGSLLLPVLTKIVEHITPILAEITDWVEAHKTLVTNILIGVGVFGVVLTVLGSILLVVGGLITAFGSFAALVIGGVGIAVAALAAGAAIVILNWTAVKTFFETMWDDIKMIFSDGWNWINDNVIKPMTQAIDSLVNKLANSAIGKAASAVGGAVSSAVGAVAGMFRASGGPVSGGSAYIVGEKGPELFVPGMSGSIVPNGGGGGGSMAISVSINGGLITDDVAKQIGNIIVQQFKRTARW